MGHQCCEEAALSSPKSHKQEKILNQSCVHADLRGYHSELQRSKGEETLVVPAIARFFVAEFTLNEAERILRATPHRNARTDYSCLQKIFPSLAANQRMSELQ